MLLEERNPETNEQDASVNQNGLGEAMGRFSRQRRMAERLKDPIVDKTQNRKQKTNLNAFKSKFLTLKKKVSALQMEVGTEPDFLLLVKNNLQDPSVAKPSKMAGKYMCYGSGEIFISHEYTSVYWIKKIFTSRTLKPISPCFISYEYTSVYWI